MSEDSSRIRWLPSAGERLPLLLILALAALLRFFRIGHQSYWADEIFSIMHASGQEGPLLQDLLHTFHGPLHFLLLRGWAEIGGWGRPGRAASRP